MRMFREQEKRGKGKERKRLFRDERKTSQKPKKVGARKNGLENVTRLKWKENTGKKNIEVGIQRSERNRSG